MLRQKGYQADQELLSSTSPVTPKVIHFAAIDQADARAARIVVIEAVPGAQYGVNAAVGQGQLYAR